MPIRLDAVEARRRFEQALTLARSEADLPLEWLENVRVIGASPSKTFIAMLGTALLAKSTNPQIDPFSLKVRDFPNAYSARALCTDVLVPASIRAGVSLGTTGREPLNNQPFFRYERVAPNMIVLGNARPYLAHLCRFLESISTLTQSEALTALAAFIRVRSSVVVTAPSLLAGRQVIGLSGFIGRIARFVERDPEGGRRGQALVAACLDLVFPDVRTSRVNDPSRHWPGDVFAFSGDGPTLSVEVKQRPVTPTEIDQFSANLRSHDIGRGMVVALSPTQPSLPATELIERGWDKHQIHLVIIDTARELVSATLIWSAATLQNALAQLPSLVLARLVELEASSDAMKEWNSIFEDVT